MRATNQKHLQIEIGGVDYSENLAFPFVVQDTGNEQLKTAIVTLTNIPTDVKFAPFTPVDLCGSKYSYVIANDAVREIFGRGRWNHELTLIDSTKATERVLMEAKSFTQPLATDFLANQQKAFCFKYSKANDDGSLTVGIDDLEAYTILDNTFISPNQRPPSGEYYRLFSIDEFCADGSIGDGYKINVSIYYSENTIVTPDVTEGYEMVLSRDVDTPSDYFYIDNSVIAKSGMYTAIYDAVYLYQGASPVRKVFVIPLAFVDNTETKKPYTLLDVLEILLETAEPLRLGLDTARYTLNLTDEQWQKFKNTTAPEFHFANGRSLMENLSEVGRYVHCVPRVDNAYKISFKELGAREYADLTKAQRFGSSSQFNAADYASALEANFANLINTDDESEGSITEPYADGFITLRSNEARIKEETSFIPTRFPIAKIKKVLLRYHDDSGIVTHTADISKYVFERSEYEMLSSFSGVYPFSKTYALFYTMGSNNIDGLWYRAEDEGFALLNSFKKYAIANIAEEALGVSVNDASSFMRLSFQVTYLPIINGRARQERVENVQNGRFVIAHNQSANKMSARAFGENLRGQIAMMSHANKSVLYMFKDLDDIPSAGTLYNDTAYISTITTRVFPHFCIAQIDLSENFNDLGAYVELKNDIRQYEIPQGETRLTLLEEYCVIGEKEENDLDVMCTDVLKYEVISSFDSYDEAQDITAVYAMTFDEDINAIAYPFTLPVYSTSIGNSVYFGFSLEDNFAAGAKSVNLSKLAYRGSKYVNYGDPLFAEAKYLSFDLVTTFLPKSYTDLAIANDLPSASGVFSSQVFLQTGVHPVVWNKDSADVGNVAYQLHFVTNDGYIIGAELARMMSFIRSSKGTQPERAKCYYYDCRINSITGFSGSDIYDNIVAESEISLTVDEVNQEFFIHIQNPPDQPFKSWVIKRSNNECIIGKNADTVPDKIYFNFKRKR